MDALFASGRIVDAILVLVAAEALLLAWLARSRGLARAPLLANLASGAALMLALRAALTGAVWPVVAGWMLAGLLAHLADLTLRLRAARTQRRSPPPAGTTPQTDAFTRGVTL
jgi:hypothetical protein